MPLPRKETQLQNRFVYEQRSGAKSKTSAGRTAVYFDFAAEAAPPVLSLPKGSARAESDYTESFRVHESHDAWLSVCAARCVR